MPTADAAAAVELKIGDIKTALNLESHQFVHVVDLFILEAIPKLDWTCSFNKTEQEVTLKLTSTTPLINVSLNLSCIFMVDLMNSSAVPVNELEFSGTGIWNLK